MENKQQTSNDYGISQELLTLSILSNYGSVSIPYGNSARYDCILDMDNKFYRIQIKSLNIVGDKIVVPMCNTRLAGKGGSVRKEYTSEDVDFIAITYNYQVYLFNPDAASQSLTVRTNKDLIKQNQHYIEDYNIEKILNIKLKSWIDLKEETRKSKPPKVNIKKYKCIDCGELVQVENSRCASCYRMMKSKNSSKPPREVLKEKIKTTPFTQIGREYNVTDNAIRKWCKSYDLPSKTSDIKKIIKQGEWETI